MKYISHVLYYPDTKPPFDKWDNRWPAFVGEFVAPIVTSRPDLLFWFSHYGTFSRFRVYTDEYEDFQDELEELRDDLGLVDRGEEKELTLVGDLGHARFISPNSRSTSQQRAELILQPLCSVARLVIDSVVKQPDSYWAFEANEDVNQNPDRSHLFSVVHLYHNMSASDAVAYLFKDDNKLQLLSYYYFANKFPNDRPDDYQRFDFKL